MIEILALLGLFFLLTPGILWSYPKKTNKYLIAIVHAVLFVFIWNVVLYFTHTKEGMDSAKDKDKDKDKAKAKTKDKAQTEDDPPIHILKFVLGRELYSDSAVTEQIKKMDGSPEIVGANQIRGDGKSYLLFTNAKNKTSKLDNLSKMDIVDMKRITDFIEFHKKYPDML
jgi:hypothetical protein